MRTTILGIITLLLFSCSTGPQPINYGKDQCALCKMMIVDRSHGSEYVTEKGKIYKFDSAECLVRYFKREHDGDINKCYVLVTDHSNPEHLIDATKAYFLISEQLPSPMGANLTSLSTPELQENYFQKYGGTKYTWEDLLQVIE